MLYSQDRKTKSESPRRTFARVSVVLVLLAISALIAGALSVSSHSNGSGSRLSNGAGERVNRRISVRDGAAPKANTGLVSAPAPPVTITVDRTDDAPTAFACTAAANDCSLRGAVRFANLNSGTTINIPAGTYQLTIPGGAGEGFSGNNLIGDLDITANNTSIVGAGAGSTIIRQTQPNDRVIEVNPFLVGGFVFSISDVTITGGHETTAVGGGGIIAGAALNVTTVTNCVFSGNSATGAGTFGGGGISLAGGSLNLSGCAFTGNSTSASGGGVSYSGGSGGPSAGVLTVTNSTFTNNTAASSAAGGAALDLFDFNGSTSVYNVTTSSFQGNSATNGSGGAIKVESGGPLTISRSSFSANHAARVGGAINAGGTATSVAFSRFAGNTVPIPTNGLTIFRNAGTLTADDNWWGVNSGPGVNDVRSSSGAVTITTWLQLENVASPNTICTGATSTLTADIKRRNVGLSLTIELNGLPAFPVPPAPIFGNAVLGTLSGASTQFVDGAATATFTAGSTPGTGAADATADNETATASIIVQATTATRPDDQAVCQGATASFSTTAGGPGPFHYAWTLDGSPYDGDNSSISVPTGSLSLGPHTVAVTVTGGCGSAAQSATLTVQENTSATAPSDRTVCQGATASFSTTASGTGPFHYAWTLDGSPFDGDNSSINVATGSLSVGNHPVSVTVSGACGSVTKNATLTVQASTTTSDPSDQTVCQGATASFSTAAGGAGPFHYAWTLDGAPFNGDNSSISVDTTALSVGNHTVAVTTTGTCGSASQSATLTVQANTTTSDPPDQTVCKGATASFSTTAGGTGPFHYAWTLDGAPFNGDNSSISVDTTALSVGNHTVTVTTTGTCGSASQSATLMVQPTTTTSDPADQTVCKGAMAGFSTTAGGTGPFHYAWTLDGAPFNGDNSSISVDTTALSVGSHTVAVTTTGTCGSASQSATLTVQPTTTTSDPSDQTVCQGGMASFSTTASGTGPFHYAWTLDGSPFNGDSPSINVDTTGLSVGNHTVAVTTTGTCGSASQSATLTVQANTTTSDPPDQTVCKGATATFSTTAGGTGPFHYAWTLDGSPFNGDNPSINVDTTGLSVGNHTVAITTTGTCGSASQSATLTVQANTTTSVPSDQTVCQGATASFSTTAGGTGPFHYAWTLDGSPFNGDSSSISVPTGSLSVGNHTVAVTTTGACGSASQSATLTVQANTTTSDPPDQTVCKGATANFSTTAGGTGPFHYAWTLDGSPFNGDSPSISVPTGSLSVGNHTVAVTTTGTCGSASQSATLTVQANTTTTDPPDTTACQGSTASFSTTASGTGPFTFVWKKGSTVLHTGDLGGRVTITSGSTTSTLTISNVQPGDAGSYTVETTGTCGTATQSATLSVNSTGSVIVLKMFHGQHDGEDEDEDDDGAPNVIWPPNHKYHKIKVTDFVASASDNCDSTVNINSVVIDHVTSDEAENAPGSGNTLNDIVIACDRKSVKLRAERIGGGNGRVYTITFKVTNQYGVTSTVTAKVYVPKDDDHQTAIDDGPHYTVTNATCP